METTNLKLHLIYLNTLFSSVYLAFNVYKHFFDMELLTY